MLEWQLKHGESNKKAKYRAQLQKVGKLKKIPNQIVEDNSNDDGPKVLPEYTWVWNGFIELASQRGFNEVGPQPINVSCVEAWGRIQQIDEYDMPWFLSMLIKLDAKFLEHTYAEMKKEREAQARKNKGGKGRR